MEFTESDGLCLIGIHKALALTFEALASLLQLGLLRGKSEQIMLLTLRPALMQCGNDTRGAQYLTE